MKKPIEASAVVMSPPMSCEESSDDLISSDFDKWQELEDGYTKEERARYWEGVWKSEGFDVEGLLNKSRSRPHNGLLPYYFERPDDCPTEILVYAKFGIHWYNMLHGKNLQLSCVQKYNNLSHGVFSDIKYITCLAMDPACGFPQVFQTDILIERTGIESIYCNIARLKFGPQEKPVEPSNEEEPPDKYEYGERTLPEWPSEDALRDENRYYLLKKSDPRKNDWIRLYLEIAFVKANRKLKHPHDLGKLVIGRVAVQSREGKLEPPSERLKAINSVFYIKYKYHPNKRRARKGLHSIKPPRDRVAVIKRTMDKHGGEITLMFETSFSKTLL